MFEILVYRRGSYAFSTLDIFSGNRRPDRGLIVFQSLKWKLCIQNIGTIMDDPWAPSFFIKIELQQQIAVYQKQTCKSVVPSNEHI